jgi:hypothetical protein
MLEQRGDVVEQDPRLRKIRDRADVVFQVHAWISCGLLLCPYSSPNPAATSGVRGGARVRGGMSRVPLAIVLGLAGLAAYIAAAVTLADWAGADALGGLRWVVQPLYFLAAGLLWVIPMRWLMLWAARK